MSWQCGHRIVAEPIGATVSGTSIAGGAQVYIDVAFRLVEWPWEEKGPLSLVPQPSEVTARAGRHELRLGFAHPNPASVLSPASHSSTGSVRFTLSLTASALVVLETARDGGSLDLIMTLTAYPFVITQYQEYAPGVGIQPTFDTYAFKVPKEQWLALLKTVGYCDTLLTELRLPSTGPETTLAARMQFARAIAARNEGRYGDAIAACRLSLDELKDTGLPAEKPPDLSRLANTSRKNMSDDDRFLLLRIATHVFASPAHHGGSSPHTREDAELAMTMTAALLRLAPRWCQNPEGEV